MASQTSRSTRTKSTGSRTTSRSGTEPGAPRKTSRSRRSGAAVRITEDRIRERAYHIYLARNGGPGNPQSDWTQAERELRAGKK